MGHVHNGFVIDKKGDVYAFSGGPAISGTSTSELGMMLRRGRSYAGTIPAAEAERLAALEGAVEREPFTQKHVEVFDAPAGGCSLLRAGAEDDALVSVPLDSIGREHGSRVGPASKSAQLVLAAAQKLVAATNSTPPTVPTTTGGGCLPFDRGAATAALFAVDLQPCALPSGPRGAGHAKITFAPDGSVRTVTVDGGPFVATPAGACVAQRDRAVRVPAFCPGDVGIGKQFAIK